MTNAKPPAGMDAGEALAYVKAAARAIGIPLDEARAERVAQNFQRTSALAALLEAVPLTLEDELAEIYRPASFPDEGGAV